MSLHNKPTHLTASTPKRAGALVVKLNKMNALEFTTEEKEIVLSMLSSKMWDIINNELDINDSASEEYRKSFNVLNIYCRIATKLNGVYC